MNILLSAILFVLCIYSTTFALPVEAPEQKFVRVDMNRDKRLTFDEFLHMDTAFTHAKKEEFDSIDKNKDGIVALGEYNDHFNLHQKRSDNLRSLYFGKVFQDFDDNIDLALDQEEVRRLLAERFRVIPRGNFPAIFHSFDRDHSGSLDLFEYMKFDSNFPFDQADPIDKGIAADESSAVNIDIHADLFVTPPTDFVAGRRA